VILDGKQCAHLVAITDSSQTFLEIGHAGRKLQHVYRDITREVNRCPGKTIDILKTQQPFEEGVKTPLVIGLEYKNNR